MLRCDLFAQFESMVSKLKAMLNTERGRVRRRRKVSNPDFSGNSFKLEDRKLLAGISFDSGTGEVLIGGTSGDDTALVEYSGDSVVVSPIWV